MESIILHIDTLSLYCGHFTSQTDANNGYGCNHPDCEEFEMLWKDKDEYTHRGYENDITKPKVKQGKCYDFSCPLAHCCDVQDLRELNSDMLDEYGDEPNETQVEGYVVCSDDKIIKLINK